MYGLPLLVAPRRVRRTVMVDVAVRIVLRGSHAFCSQLGLLAARATGPVIDIAENPVASWKSGSSDGRIGNSDGTSSGSWVGAARTASRSTTGGWSPVEECSMTAVPGP